MTKVSKIKQRILDLDNRIMELQAERERAQAEMLDALCSFKVGDVVVYESNPEIEYYIQYRALLGPFDRGDYLVEGRRIDSRGRLDFAVESLCVGHEGERDGSHGMRKVGRASDWCVPGDRVRITKSRGKV